jgi:glyoxylase-like metal-dependent hydrolase (beta-lactamase superfamily II)
MKITDNCYAVLGLGYFLPWMVNSGFVIGSNKTLVIDSGPNYLAAQTIYGYAKNIRPENEIIVVNTEKHFDHFLGNSFFKEMGVSIYGHKNVFRSEEEFEEEKKYFNENIENVVRKAAKEENVFFQKTIIVNPDHTLEDNQIFDLGGIEAKVIFTPGHTVSNISIYIPQEKVLYCGDLIVNGYIPNLESAKKEDWVVWLNSLELISSFEINYIIPGHGDVLKNNEVNKGIIRIKKLLDKAVLENKAPTSI